MVLLSIIFHSSRRVFPVDSAVSRL